MQSNDKIGESENIKLITKIWDRIGKFFSMNNISKADIETVIKQVRSENE